jgi:hypothetical protein
MTVESVTNDPLEPNSWGLHLKRTSVTTYPMKRGLTMSMEYFDRSRCIQGTVPPKECVREVRKESWPSRCSGAWRCREQYASKRHAFLQRTPLLS